MECKKKIFFPFGLVERIIDGTQSRDLIYIDDNVRCTWLAFLNGKLEESYNVGTGISKDYNTIAVKAKQFTGSRFKIVHVVNPLKSY